MANASLDDSYQGSTYRRIELITGVARRRRWTVEEKAEILAESFQPGARVSEVALRYGVNRGLLWAWRRQVRTPAMAGRTFVPLRIAEEATAPERPAAAEPNAAAASAAAVPTEVVKELTAGGSIEIRIGKLHVRVSGVVDAAVLQQVLAQLRTRNDLRPSRAAGAANSGDLRARSTSAVAWTAFRRW